MRQDERAPFVTALEEARVRAYPPGQFVGQESFMLADEIIALGLRAGIGPNTQVLDLCCGIGGPGRHLAAELGCDYLGLDYSASAIVIARQRARGLPCRFDIAHVPPLPSVRADVVLLLEAMLAFEAKATLVQQISRVLPAGGRFALTLEAGLPLTQSERDAIPDADTVWPTPLPDMIQLLGQAGLRVRWFQDCTDSHLVVAESLLRAFAAAGPAITAHVGRRALDDLLAAHRLWSAWLGSRRIRKFALVAEKIAENIDPMARSEGRNRRRFAM